MRLCTFRDAGRNPPGSGRGRRRPAARGPGRARRPRDGPARGVRAAGSAGRGWSCSRAAAPGKLLGIGLNYRDHAAETGARRCRRSRCCSPSSSPRSRGRAARSSGRRYTDELDYEGELAVVIGRTAPRRAGRGGRLDHVFGYAVMNDVSRARPPARGAPVDPREGRRRLRPVRALDHDGRRGARPAGARPSAPGSTAICARTAPPRDMVFSVADAHRLLLGQLHPASRVTSSPPAPRPAWAWRAIRRRSCSPATG